MLNLPQESPRDYVIGMVNDGWMIYDGQWKLCKYATGEILLFDLLNDPQEQHNLAQDSSYWERYMALDKRLTQEILRSVKQSHESLRVYRQDLSSDVDYGKEGWQRPYPYRLGGALK